LNAAYNDTPVDPPNDDEIPNPFDLVLLTPGEVREIQQEEPVDINFGDYEFNYWYRVNMVDAIPDNWQGGWLDISELYNSEELQLLKSGFEYRMAQLAARACQLMLPPVETETNYSAFKLTNNNCFSSKWWEQRIIEDIAVVDIEVQKNSAINLRSDEKNIVNLKF